MAATLAGAFSCMTGLTAPNPIKTTYESLAPPMGLAPTSTCSTNRRLDSLPSVVWRPLRESNPFFHRDKVACARHTQEPEFLAGRGGAAPPCTALEATLIAGSRPWMNQDSGLPGGQLFPGWVLSAACQARCYLHRSPLVAHGLDSSEIWSGQRELHPLLKLGKLAHY